MTNFDYEGKIAALLNKAEAGGTTPQEAEALSAAAERLMIKYSIDRAMMDARRASGKANEAPEEITTVKIVFKGEYRDSYIAMSNAIVNALGNLRVYTDGGNANQFRKTGKPLYIVGFKPDAEAAHTLVASLQIQAMAALGVWWKSEDRTFYTQSQRLRARRQFTSSFGAGAAERICTARAKAMQEAEAREPGTALAVRDRQAAVDSHVSRLGLSSARASRKRADFDAISAGMAAGRRADTGGPRIGGGRTAISGR